MTNPVWTKVTAVLAEEPEEWSNWAEVFERHGIAGTVQTDNPPTMSAYLAPGAEDAFPALREELLDRGAQRVETELVPEEDWAESWKQFFKPRYVGQFLIRPTWEEATVRDGAIEIVLDPGQAFGTGDHPTTRMCLELLESTVQDSSDVADIGCGSGILSIAAMKLGAASVTAVDTDPLSIEATLENAERNHVAVDGRCGKGFEPLPQDSKYDVVVSNIISAALISLAPETARRIKAGGVWLVSGIIEANWNDVLKASERCGFQLKQVKSEGEWVAAALLR